MGITKEQIKKALLNSGYLLEDRVNQILIENNWSTIPNSRFKDLKTDIEREIDVVGYKYLNYYSPQVDNIDSTLLIECMNNKEPIVFFENIRPLPSRIAALNFTILNENFWSILSWTQSELKSKKTFVYSSQYCSFTKVQKLIKEFNNGWIALHPDIKHDSINSLFQYIQFKRTEHKDKKNTNEFIKGFYYRPLIILQGELLSVKQKKELEIKNRNHIKFQVAITDNGGKYFDIDVITEKHLPEYLKLIEEEDNAIANMIEKHREKLID
ncbi:hypothetical protein [Snuella sedimenti]|uniref:Uncharacterized protein n=1 Tax=Snuella sedimenti TaxID=2798802 RepID=A0A8J7J1S9_9FLAO|nr:hypothetical protein [Snuella sedimenti]MBJ6368137.1 hypothetical protein [Snuella sedimenti]